MPVAPWATASAPTSAAISICRLAISGRAIEVPRTTEAAALGTAVLAGCAVGLFDDPVRTARRLNPIADRFAPDASHRAIYDGLRQVYEALYEAILPLYVRVEEVLRR